MNIYVEVHYKELVFIAKQMHALVEK